MQATNATSNGGDASRVGILRQKFTDKRVISAACEPMCMNLCLNARRETPPLEVAFVACLHLVLAFSV